MDRNDRPSFVPAQPGLPPPQVDNPTNAERYALIKYALQQADRLEDFDSIITNLAPPQDITTIAPPGQFKGIRVGVIGGGSAGLATAFELRKLGYDITVFEASPNRVGGRIFTHYFDLERRNYGELGAMRIPITHETAWYYMNLFRLNTRPYVQYNPNGFIYVRNTRVRNDPEGLNVSQRIYPKFDLQEWERNTPWQELLSYALETPLLNMSPEVREELLQIRDRYSAEIVYWDSFSIRKVMEASCLSEGAISLLSRISPIVGSLLQYSYMEVLMESNPLSFEYLYEIEGGLSNLPYSFYYSLINPTPTKYGKIPLEALGNITFRTGSQVDGLYLDRDGRVRLTYTNRSLVAKQEEVFDYVVSAIPLSNLRNIEIYPQFSNPKMQAIKEVGYPAAHKMLFLCNRRFWEEGGPDERIVGGGSFTDLPISSIWYPSDHAQCIRNEKDNRYKWSLRENCSPCEPGVFTASYNFDLDAVRVGNIFEDVAFEKIKRQVEQVHGLPNNYLDYIVEDYVRINWNHYPYSLGGFSYFLPNQKVLFSYPIIVPEYNNRVFFAGEHASPSHGWINGALRTGMLAANNIAYMSKVRMTK